MGKNHAWRGPSFYRKYQNGNRLYLEILCSKPIASEKVCLVSCSKYNLIWLRHLPAIADYEVRRELERAGRLAGIAELNTWNTEYLPLPDSALRLAAKLWAQARSAGTTTADPKELDGDVLIAAQAIDMGFSPSDFIIATTNPGHLSQFAPSDLWTNIRP